MKLISHRGNLNGPSELENNPDQIKKVLSLGFDCEVDVWCIDGVFFLGHDEPQYPIDPYFLQQKGLWLHCKNFSALEACPENSNYFWHEADRHTLTSKKFIWTYPENITGEKSIIVDNNKNWKSKSYNCFGVCSDYILV